MALFSYSFTFLLSFLLFNAPAQSLSGPSGGYLNISASTTLAYSSGLPGSITSAPSSATAKKCPLCVVNFGISVPEEPVRFYWYNSTLGLTLDTVSIIVTQYNNTAITRTTTIHGDVNSLNISTITTALEAASAFIGDVLEYPSPPPVVLANGTEGSLFNGKSIPYPTAYAEFTVFAYTTITEQSPNCPAGLQDIGGRCDCALTSLYPVWQGQDDARTSSATLSKAYYNILSGTYMSGYVNDFGFNNVSISEWVMSDTALMSAMPQLSTCFYNNAAHGPPAVKIPVSALTATSTTTVQGSGQYSSQGAQPGNSVTSSVPTPTSKVPAGSETLSAPSKPLTVETETTQALNDAPFSSLPGGADAIEKTSVITAAVYSNKVSPSPTLEIPDPPNPPQPSAGSPSPALQSDNPETLKGLESPNRDPEPNKQNRPVPAEETNPIPIIIFGGSTINADSSSYYALPSIGILKPGGSDITTNNIVYSLAPSVTAIISNGDLIPLDHVGQPTYAKLEPTPILSFGTSVYTADSSSRFIISGQTVKPGGPAITIAGTPISLDAAGSVAVIGTSTRPLVTAPPVQAPALTFAGSTFKANSASQFIVAGQTLRQGSQITVSGVPISLDSGGTVAIIGTSTQNLIHAYSLEITHGPVSPVQETPILTFAGSTFRANSASQFVVAGQTLKQGNQITVSGVPISLDSGGTVAIIGTSTQHLVHDYDPRTTDVLVFPSNQQTPVLTFAGSTFTANSASHFVVAGQTLTQGGQITVSGTPISLDQNGKTALVGTSTQPLIHDYDPRITHAPVSPLIQQTPVLTFGGSTLTAIAASQFVIAGQTLTQGGQITVSGTLISLAQNGKTALIGTSTQPLIHDSTPTPTRALIFTLGATTYTADVSSHFIINGQTLVPGGVLTIAGTRVSYPPTGSDIIIGTSTEAIHLGSLILQAFGATTETANTAVSTPGLDRAGNGSTAGVTGGVEGFPGAARRGVGLGGWASWWVVAGLVVWWCVLWG